MQNKALQRNVIAAVALAAGSTTFSAAHVATWGKGVRLIITVAAGATTTGGIDTVFLCGFAPGNTTPIPLVGFALASGLSVAGVYFADFYPGAWLPPTIAAGGNLLGVAGIYLPINWSVQLVMGAGSVATVTVDAEMLP